MTASRSKQVRDQVQQQRKQLLKEDLRIRSEKIVTRFIKESGLHQVKEPLTVGLYRALPFELSPLLLESEWTQQGWRLCFPRVRNRDSKEIEFVEVKPDAISSWRTGAYGIQEPGESLQAIDPNELDLILVPGVAFGEHGERLGMGLGYYDRFLRKAPRALRVALAFDFQVFPHLEQEVWDQPVHWVWTETREFRTEFVEEWLENWITE